MYTLYNIYIYTCVVRDGVFVLGQLLYCFAYAAEASLILKSYQVSKTPAYCCFFCGYRWHNFMTEPDSQRSVAIFGTLEASMALWVLISAWQCVRIFSLRALRWAMPGWTWDVDGYMASQNRYRAPSGSSCLAILCFKTTAIFCGSPMGQQGNFNGCYHRMILLGSTHDVCRIFSEKPKKWRI